MKKFWIVLIAAIIISITLIYILIPGNIIIGKIIYTDVKSTSILRCLHDDSKWEQWFPGKMSNGTFIYQNQQYQPKKKEYASQEVSILINNRIYSSTINVIPISVDSSILEWKCEFKASTNFFKRFMQYQTAKKINTNIQALLDSFAAFTKNVKNIYGFDIKYTTLTDTALVSLKTVTKEYPSTQLIYSLMDTLKEYIQQQHATIHNYPMLNTKQLVNGSYTVTVGVPTNIPLKGTIAIEPKRMIMIKNKTLVTFVNGDISMIKKALQATTDYMNDYQLAPPVIPFQQLVTDRSKQKDSTKWITRIFSPII